jgi:hypothetical protein
MYTHKISSLNPNGELNYRPSKLVLSSILVQTLAQKEAKCTNGNNQNNPVGDRLHIKNSSL